MYSIHVDSVLEYIGALEIFVAPTTHEPQLRKHIEGSIGWNLRKNHPEAKALYPDDNHVGTGATRGWGLQITSDVPIAGLDERISL
jgi:hypothetical protein